MAESYRLDIAEIAVAVELASDFFPQLLFLTAAEEAADPSPRAFSPMLTRLIEVELDLLEVL